MKISQISYNNTSFGYDKKLNDDLKQALKEYPDREFAKTLQALNSQCNALERTIKREEKKEEPNKTLLSDYSDLFLSLKQSLTAYVSVYLENLKFADREHIHYEDEFIKRGCPKDDWRLDACNHIAEWISDGPVVKLAPDKNEDDDDDDEPTSPVSVPKPVKPTSPASSASAMQPAKATLKLSEDSCLQRFEPTVSSPKGFSDVAGMYKLKETLKEGILQMLQNPQQAQLDFEEYGKKVPRGLLLYGPPGCGKTYITEALAGEIESPMFLLDIGHVGSEYVNQTAKNITSAFDELVKFSNETEKPILLFMDEIDAVGFARNSNTWAEDKKQVASLLTSLDKIKDRGVIVIAATNKYDNLDSAVKRRFDEHFLVDVPDEDARKALVLKYLTTVKKGANLASDEGAISEIVKELNGHSSDSICKIARNAGKNALKRDRADISLQDFKQAISDFKEEKPSTKDYLPEHSKARKVGFASN